MGLRAIILMWVCFGWGMTALAAGPPLSLSEAMLLALKHNPALAAAGMTVETAEADLAKARARSCPRLTSRRPTTIPIIPLRSS